MRHCKRCVMPDTRPGTIFGDDGVCQACHNYEQLKTVDWQARLDELKSLCDKYRRPDGRYDCVVATSGGKDSHFLVYMMKERMGMNPLLVCVADPFTHTEAGLHNLRNLGESFGCDTIVFNMNTELFRKTTKIGFEELGEPLRYIEATIYTVPPKYAVAFDIPLIVYGENAAFTYGAITEDGYSAKRYIEAGHSASGEKLGDQITDFWRERGMPMEQMNAVVPPPQEDLDRVKPEPIFMSYFVPWDDERNYAVAKRFGFKDVHHEWQREGCLEDYGQIDSMAYLVHIWMKFPKFGFARVTDIAARWIRKGTITREEGVGLVMEHDRKLDQKSQDDFVSFMGYRHREFWDIMDRFWNQELFEKVDDVWQPKDVVYRDFLEGE